MTDEPKKPRRDPALRSISVTPRTHALLKSVADARGIRISTLVDSIIIRGLDAEARKVSRGR